MKFFKTVVQVEVLSEEQPVDDLDLAQIAHEIYEGDCVGSSSIVSVKELTGKECADALYEVGCEPEFFNLDDDGVSLLEDY